jgi:hypothetical protein
VFAAEDIPKNAPVTEYGGKLITHEQAMVLLKKGISTHTMTVASMHTAIDGRASPEFTHTDMLAQHKVGSMFNDPHGTNKVANAMRKPLDIGDTVVLVATTDIPAHTELLLDYGPSYRRTYFKS